ncbi:MAG: type II toxin-antitoxin system HicB family antitoxin [Deltaproteobacteria bacterium]|nr:type II toxin-antitoxin system HicB family antitoxin [Deltaproteobacteria bacterium]
MDEAVIRLKIAGLPEGGYVATSPDVPGLVAQGRTLAETAEIAQDVARKILESCLEHGDPIPPVFRRHRHALPASLAVAVGLPAGR